MHHFSYFHAGFFEEEEEEEERRKERKGGRRKKKKGKERGREGRRGRETPPDASVGLEEAFVLLVDHGRWLRDQPGNLFTHRQ